MKTLQPLMGSKNEPQSFDAPLAEAYLRALAGESKTPGIQYQLAEAGRVRLDDSVERYVPSLPYGGSVTLRQLISHTSGIPNPIPLRWVHPAAAHKNFDEHAALATVLRDHPRLSFTPGTKYGYSNIGYWLLGAIVERASGETFQSYVSEHILRPLGITPAELGYVVVDPNRHATGYLEKYSLMNLAKGLLIDRDLIGEYAGRWLAIRDRRHRHDERDGV